MGHIFAKPKDPDTKEQRTDAIYSIPCNDCDNEYIGQTKRQFGTRLKEHQNAFFFYKKKNSALSEHTCQTNYAIGWDNSRIITTNRRYHQRFCLEAWHINSAHAPRNHLKHAGFRTRSTAQKIITSIPMTYLKLPTMKWPWTTSLRPIAKKKTNKHFILEVITKYDGCFRSHHLNKSH